MGRRWKPQLPEPDGTEPVEGIETKERVYFEKPTLVLVGKAEEEYSARNHYSGGTSRVNEFLREDEARSLQSRVRLTSSRNVTMCTNQPDFVTYPLTMYPTYNEAQDYLKQNKIHGYGPGAIVTRRFANQWRFRNVHQWGVILYETGNPTFQQRWSPYEIKWFEAGSSTEKAWAEDLVIIHACLSDDVLTDLLECQGIVK
jgi:hypothetical protein